MKKIIVGCVILIMGVIIFAFTRHKEDPNREKLILELITFVLSKGHYSPKEFNDTFSETVFDDFIDALDDQHRFFLKKDIESFDKYKYAVDEEIKQSSLSFFYTTYGKYEERLKEVEGFYNELLDVPFDFNKEETIDLDSDNLNRPENLDQLKNRWREILKYSTLDIYTDLKKTESNKVKKDSVYVALADSELEKQARELTLEYMDTYFEQRNELTEDDFFALYANIITSTFDPHTNYFAPEVNDNFQMGLSGNFEGIGARLQKEKGKIKIVEIISGGPLWRDNLMKPGDKILKVAQPGEPSVDIATLKLSDAIKLIKGPKGTDVILTVERVDGTIEDITVTRDVIEILETFAKSSLIVDDNFKFGIIYLPKFNIDFNSNTGRAASKDVKNELLKLKKEGVQGIILDLRNNGGGSLQEAVNLTGLFIEKGPVVQVKSVGGGKRVLGDEDESVEWNGPLVILVNEFSASASEIVASALQDYHRAIIIGSRNTFGKGTVQNLINLDKVIQNATYSDLGSIKITTDKFYRISGGSTQLEGVKSDILLPDRYSLIPTGERDQENPLVYDRITPLEYQTYDISNFDYVINKSDERVKNNPYFSLIESQAKELKENHDNPEYLKSLNYNEYNKKLEQVKLESKKYDKLKEYKSDLDFSPSSDELGEYAENEDYKEIQERWRKNLKKDLVVTEAVMILEDLILSKDMVKNINLSQSKN